MKTAEDFRSQLAIERDEWFQSPEGIRCCQGSASGEYLRNRLELAFFAGVKSGEKLCGGSIAIAKPTKRKAK